MSRYIDADALLEEFKTLEQLARKRVCDTPTNSPAYERYRTQYSERERALSIIKAQATADVVEVVRCRDCNHRKTPNCYLWVGSIADTDYLISTSDDFYCIYGERREEE